jgi:type IV pilus assembly protein PilC
MGNWRFEGVHKDGKREVGVIQASSEREVRKLLRARGVRVKRLTPPSILEFDITEWMVDNGFAAPFGVKELMGFTKQLSTMIDAGIPIIQALEILYKQEKHLVLKKTIKKVASDVGEGKTIAEAMQSQKGFSKLYCNLIKAGEAGGILNEILNKLAIHLEKQVKTSKQIKSAMAYPFIVTLVGIGVVWGLMVFVVPQFVDMLADTGQEVPAITQIVMDTSEFLINNSIVMVPAFIAGVTFLMAWVKTPSGKVIFDQVTMHMPIFGPIVVKGNLSSFTRTLATMLSAGVSLIDALDICTETIDNGVVAKDLKQVKKKIVEGKTLAEPVEKIAYFPPMVAQMIRVGEQTGQLDQMLERVANVFEEEVNTLVEGMTKLIEPLIIVVLGGLIAFVLVAMYLPVFMTAGGA